MSTYRSQLADDIERHGLKGYVLNGHYLGKAQEEVIAALRATPPEERAIKLLKRLRQWDMLDACADGPYWKREIDALVSPQLEKKQ